MLSRVILLILQVIAIHTALGQVNLNNGLVAWLPFTLNSFDASGNGNNGIPQNGVQLTTDRFGNANSAYYFDGVDDHIVIQDKAKTFSSTPFSTVVWFQTVDQKMQVIVGKRDFGPTNGQQFQIALFKPGETLSAAVISNAIACSADLTPGVISVSRYSEPFCLEKWHCVIVTFDGAFQKMYLDGKLVIQHVPDFNTMLQCSSDIRLGNWWSGDPLWFKGKLDDFRWYNRVLNDEEIKLLSSDVGTSLTLDFIYKKNACDSKMVQFTQMSAYANNFKWQFGDGTESITTGPATHIYPANGIYTVKLIEEGENNCSDSVSKFIDLGINKKDIIMTAPDTSICPGDSVRFRTTELADFCWNSNPSLWESNTAHAYAKPATSTTYYLAGEVLKGNLIKNSDFNNSNRDFTSDYQFTTSKNAIGQYGLVKAPKEWDSRVNCPTCRDHTKDGIGLMMVANGPPTAEKSVWCQTVDVIPGKIYKIGFWGSIYSGGFLTRPAIFLNGIKAGELEYALQDYFEWTNFSGYWNSGSATKVDVCIRIIPNANADNVFAIDDILFAESEMFMDSVKMNVAKPGALTVSDDSSICKGNSVQLFASGGNSYTWSPVAGLSNPNSPNPVASPQQTTKYYVTSTPSGAKCAAKDSVLVTIAQSPELITSPDVSLCSGGSIQLSVSGATTYKWTPIDGLSDPNSPSPVASPSVTTLYHVEGANAGGCKDTSSVKVIVSAEAKLYVPTAFTPNNDGVNDCFRIPNASGSINFELSIFNRFGEKVFYSSDPGKCWDGTYKAKREPAGVFVYYLKMTNGCGNIIKKGTVSIIY